MQYTLDYLCKMGFKVCSCFDVFTNSVAKSRVDNVPLVRHLSCSFAQHLINQVTILLRFCSQFLWSWDNVTAMLCPDLVVRDTVDNIKTLPARSLSLYGNKYSNKCVEYLISRVRNHDSNMWHVFSRCCVLWKYKMHNQLYVYVLLDRKCFVIHDLSWSVKSIASLAQGHPHFFIWAWFCDGPWQIQAVYQIWNR